MPRKFQPHNYITEIPETVPPGMLLVHNFIPSGQAREVLSLDGFRAYLVPENEKPANIVLCDCGWAPGNGKVHYNVVLLPKNGGDE
jgi:hypothetical protein